MKAQALKFPAQHSDKIMAVAGAALMAVAIVWSGALHARQAHAATPVSDTSTPRALPTLYVVAAADTTANDATPVGFRAKMRERIQERVQERMKDYEKEHPPIDKKLTSDQVRDIVEGHIAMSGNSNLKVGKVTVKEEGVVAVDVVTKTGALVATREISTKTGLPVNLEGHLGGIMGGGMMEHGIVGQNDHPRPRAMMQERSMSGGKTEKRDLALTVDQAKKLAEARLIMLGNKNLKVGAVKEKDADTISVDIVASDNSLVAQRLINRHSGRPERG